MLAAERESVILDELREHGSLRVADLTERFGVTEETVRRDLRKLSDQGKLKRAHGGAVRIEPEEAELEVPYNQRRHTNIESKRAIAAAAVGLVEPGSVIGLDASSTACELARLLPDEPLTVVTNSMVCCLLLSRKKRIETICTGGVLDESAAAFMGFAAERALRSLNVQQLFFSCRGIDLKRGLSEASDPHASLKLCLLESAERSVLLADTSKLGVASAVFFAPASRPDRLVVEAEHESLQLLRGRGVAVMVAGS